MKKSIIALATTMATFSAEALSTSGAVRRGAFIVFEGIDRCGKTTQCNLLVDHVKRLTSESQVEFIRFPNRESCIGKLINNYLTTATSNINDHTIHLLFSANRWESRDMILEKLNSGVTLICDRYAYSGVAFSSAKGMDFDWCKACDKVCIYIYIYTCV